MRKKMIKKIWDNFKLFVRAMNPPIVGYATQYDIKQVLEKKMGIKRQKYEITDTHFRLVNASDMERLLKFNVSRLRAYRKNTYDCDDSAKVLLGQMSLLVPNLAFGIVHVKRSFEGDLHALNFVVTRNKKLFYCEPQSGVMFNEAFGRKMKGYKPYFAYI